MKVKEYEKKTSSLIRKVVQESLHSPTKEQIRSMATDELVRLIMSPEMARPANATVRQQIVEILQEREGNAFVERLLGKTSEETAEET